MSKDLLVLADEYAAATATFARALALKDGADSMSPIAREAGDKRAALAEAIAALDTAQAVQVNAMLVESVTGVDQVSAVNEARAALTAAKQAQPEPSEMTTERESYIAGLESRTHEMRKKIEQLDYELRVARSSQEKATYTPPKIIDPDAPHPCFN